jgi:hypothetical protein
VVSTALQTPEITHTIRRGSPCASGQGRFRAAEAQFQEYCREGHIYIEKGPVIQQGDGGQHRRDKILTSPPHLFFPLEQGSASRGTALWVVTGNSILHSESLVIHLCKLVWWLVCDALCHLEGVTGPLVLKFAGNKDMKRGIRNTAESDLARVCFLPRIKKRRE